MTKKRAPPPPPAVVLTAYSHKNPCQLPTSSPIIKRPSPKSRPAPPPPPSLHTRNGPAKFYLEPEDIFGVGGQTSPHGSEDSGINADQDLSVESTFKALEALQQEFGAASPASQHSSFTDMSGRKSPAALSSKQSEDETSSLWSQPSQELVFFVHENDFWKDQDPANHDDISHIDGYADDEGSELFAGVRGLYDDSANFSLTIRSHRGTIRGVKNRVRAGIATFLRDQRSKCWDEKEQGKVVVYLTTLGIIRETWARCLKVRHIFRTLLIKVEERDVFMSSENQFELIQRTGQAHPELPQVFINGQYFADAEMLEKLNESGELRQLLKAFKSLEVNRVCERCGGFTMLPCPVCNGSKKSLHRNHFMAQFVALRCTHCDESGLVKCDLCHPK